VTRRKRTAGLGLSLFQLGLEAQTVAALRLMKIAAGGAEAEREARRMVAEKIEAATVANGHLAMGLLSGSPEAGQRKAIAHYRRKVRQNLRRLSR
jgi:hypothetical protein